MNARPEQAISGGIISRKTQDPSSKFQEPKPTHRDTSWNLGLNEGVNISNLQYRIKKD
jgi:hypothetical protein